MSFLRAHALAALSALSLSLVACGGAIGSSQTPGEVGTKAPSFTMQSLNGKGAVSLNGIAGKVTVVEFWATWCEPCKKSLVDLEELRKKSGGTIEVIGIAVDDTPRGVEAFAKAQGLSFPIAWDENHSMMFRWSVTEMPSTFVLDGKGRIRFVHEPEKNKDPGELIAREVAQLGEENAPPAEPKSAVAAAEPTTAPHVALAVAVAVAEPTPAPAPEPTPAAEEAKPHAKPTTAKKGASKGAAKATKKKKSADGASAS